MPSAEYRSLVERLAAVVGSKTGPIFPTPLAAIEALAVWRVRDDYTSSDFPVSRGATSDEDLVALVESADEAHAAMVVLIDDAPVPVLDRLAARADPDIAMLAALHPACPTTTLLRLLESKCPQATDAWRKRSWVFWNANCPPHVLAALTDYGDRYWVIDDPKLPNETRNAWCDDPEFAAWWGFQMEEDINEHRR